MAKNFIISALWGAVLGLILPFAAASAGPCDGRKPCDAAPPGLYERDRSIERRLEREFFRTQDLQRGVAKNRRKARRSIEIYSPRGDDDDQFVQNYGEGDSLIGPTEALNLALAAVPGGKALGVKLLKGPTPVYAVRLRVRGRVRQIFVDARTAQVLGE